MLYLTPAWAARLTTLFGLNGTTTVDYDSIRITQNSVIDLLSATIPNAPTIRFELGGGGRAFGTIGLPITASCDGSQWLHPFGDISCL